MTDDDKVFIEIAGRIRERGKAFENITTAESFMPRMADRIEALSAENERLREAGKDLGFYAGHDDSCDCVKGWAKGPCNCGYTETWKQWTAALGETK